RGPGRPPGAGDNAGGDARGDKAPPRADALGREKARLAGPGCELEDRLARPGIDLVDEPVGHRARPLEQLRPVAFPRQGQELCALVGLRLARLGHAGNANEIRPLRCNGSRVARRVPGAARRFASCRLGKEWVVFFDGSDEATWLAPAEAGAMPDSGRDSLPWPARPLRGPVLGA